MFYVILGRQERSTILHMPYSSKQEILSLPAIYGSIKLQLFQLISQAGIEISLISLAELPRVGICSELGNAPIWKSIWTKYHMTMLCAFSLSKKCSKFLPTLPTEQKW